MIVTSLSIFISQSNKTSFPSLLPSFISTYLPSVRSSSLPRFPLSYLPSLLFSILPSIYQTIQFIPSINPFFLPSFLPFFLLSFFSSFSPSLTSPSSLQNFIIFSELLEHDQDYLPAVLGMATGFMVEKAQVCVTIAKMREKRD